MLTTFGIHLFLTILPAKKVSVFSGGLGKETLELRKWDTGQYMTWLGNYISFNPQISEHGSGKWQVSEFNFRAGNTITLCAIAFLLASFMGIFTGTIQSTLEFEPLTGQKRFLPAIMSNSSATTLYFFSSIPAYIIAYVLFLLMESESNMFMAILALALGSGSAMDISRFTSNAHSRQLYSRYVENAIATGLKTSGFIPLPGYVAWHAFRNSLISILPVTAYRIPLIVSSALVVEVVFDLPGLGESLLSSLINQDVPMILSIVLVSVVFVQVCVFLAELLVFILYPQKYSAAD